MLGVLDDDVGGVTLEIHELVRDPYRAHDAGAWTVDDADAGYARGIGVLDDDLATVGPGAEVGLTDLRLVVGADRNRDRADGVPDAEATGGVGGVGGVARVPLDELGVGGGAEAGDSAARHRDGPRVQGVPPVASAPLREPDLHTSGDVERVAVRCGVYETQGLDTFEVPRRALIVDGEVLKARGGQRVADLDARHVAGGLGFVVVG